MIRFCSELEKEWAQFVSWRGTSDGAKAYAYKQQLFVFKERITDKKKKIKRRKREDTIQDLDYWDWESYRPPKRQKKFWELEKEKKGEKIRLGRQYEAEDYFWSSALGEDKKEDLEFMLAVRRASLWKMYKKYQRIKTFIDLEEYRGPVDKVIVERNLKARKTKEIEWITQIFKCTWPKLAYDRYSRFKYGQVLEDELCYEEMQKKSIEEYVNLRRALDNNTSKFRKLARKISVVVNEKRKRQEKKYHLTIQLKDRSLISKMKYMLDSYETWDPNEKELPDVFQIIIGLGFYYSPAEERFFFKFWEDAIIDDKLEDEKTSPLERARYKELKKEQENWGDYAKHKDYKKVLSGEIIVKTKKEKEEELAEKERLQKEKERLQKEREKLEEIARKAEAVEKARIKKEKKKKKEESAKMKILNEIQEFQRNMRKQRAWLAWGKTDEYFETWKFLDKDYKEYGGVGFEVMRSEWWVL